MTKITLVLLAMTFTTTAFADDYANQALIRNQINYANQVAYEQQLRQIEQEGARQQEEIRRRNDNQTQNCTGEGFSRVCY